jgi:hypothetical protein
MKSDNKSAAKRVIQVILMALADQRREIGLEEEDLIFAVAASDGLSEEDLEQLQRTEEPFTLDARGCLGELLSLLAECMLSDGDAELAELVLFETAAHQLAPGDEMTRATKAVLYAAERLQGTVPQSRLEHATNQAIEFLTRAA